MSDRVKLTAAAFRQGIDAVSGALAGRTTRPILTHYRLKAGGDGVFLEANNGYVGATARIAGAEVEGELDVILSGGKTQSIAKEHAAGEVTITRQADKLKVQCDGGVYTLPQHGDGDTFPGVAEVVEACRPAVTVLGSDLKKAVRRIGWAVSKSEDDKNRFSITGVFLKVRAGKLDVVGSGPSVVFLSVASSAFEPGEDGAGLGVLETDGVLVQLRGLEMAAAGAADGDRVGIALDGNRVVFSHPCGAVTAATMENRFPPYWKAIPAVGEAAWKFDDGFAAAVRRAAIFVEKETKRVELALGPKATVTGRSAEDGESVSEADLVEYAGQGLHKAFGGDYLSAVCKAMGREEQVTVDTSAKGPIVFRHAEGLVILQAMGVAAGG